jgi:hypothetical protein
MTLKPLQILGMILSAFGFGVFVLVVTPDQHAGVRALLAAGAGLAVGSLSYVFRRLDDYGFVGLFARWVIAIAVPTMALGLTGAADTLNLRETLLATALMVGVAFGIAATTGDPGMRIWQKPDGERHRHGG